MIILCGPSAVGKTEIAKELSKTYGITKAVTTTTRPIRVNEVNDVDYHFLTIERFEELLKEDYFVENVKYNGNYYGCGKNEVRDDRVVILEPEGVSNFLKLNNPHIVVIILWADEKTRIARMRYRKDKEEDIVKRIEGDKLHFSKERLSFADFTIDTENKTIEEIAKEVYSCYKEKLNA